MEVWRGFHLRKVLEASLQKEKEGVWEKAKERQWIASEKEVNSRDT